MAMKCSMPGLFANIVRDLRRRDTNNVDSYVLALEEIIENLQQTVAGQHTLAEFATHYCIPSQTQEVRHD